jgi:PPM family protein phosphatase
MLISSFLSDKGRVRTANQDYCAVVPELGLYVLADGMGGARGGEEASRLAVETVVSSLQQAYWRDLSVLLEAVRLANQRVQEEASRNANLLGMGTTLVAALAQGDNMAIVSVGDSRAYLFHDDHLQLITQDQTWVNEVGIPLGLNSEVLRTHPMRHVLTMAIGINSDLTIRYYTIRLDPDAILLLCSDGLHGVVEQSVIAYILGAEEHNCTTLEQKCQALIKAACDAGAPDNVSVVLVKSVWDI